MLSYSDKIINNTIYGGKTDVKGLKLNQPAFAALRATGLESIGMARIEGPYIMTRKGGSERDHTHYHLLLEGSELLETFNEEFRVEAGSFVVTPQRISRRHSLKKGESYLFIYAGFNNEAAAPALIFDEVRCGRLSNPELLAAVFNTMHEESQERMLPESETLMKASAEIFLSLLQRDLATLRDSRESQESNSLRELWSEVEGSLDAPWSFASMAKEAGVSKTQLHKLCLRLYGQAPCERLCSLRMEKARRLLFESQEKLEALAAKVGYGSAYAFSKAFLKRYGIRPGAFRQSF